MLFQLFIIGAILSLLIVAFVHSFFGEKILLRPMFKYRGNKVLESKLARMVLRFAWHLTSLLWVFIAGMIYTAGFSPEHLPSVILLTFGAGFVGIGIFDLIASRGKHIGWPILTAIGACCLGAYAVMGTSS